MKKKLGVFIAALAIVASLSLSVATFATIPEKPKRPTAYDVYADGKYDVNTALVSEKTFAVMQQSVRVVRVLYAEQKTLKEPVRQTDYTGVLVSEDTVLVSEQLMRVSNPEPGKQYAVVSVTMLPSIDDPEGTKPEKLDLDLARYEPESFPGALIFQRSVKSIDLDPVRFGEITDVFKGTFQYVVGVDGAQGKDGRTVPASTFATVSNSKGDTFLYIGMTTPAARLGDPVFALRDGTPEFVGVVIGSTSQSLVVLGSEPISTYLLKEGFPVQGIS